VVEKAIFVPSAQDIIWLEFDPQKGRETQKNRPALVISPKEYNVKVGLSLCLPITSKIKGYPFEVLLQDNKVIGAILCDQIRSLDWRARNAEFITKCDEDVFAKVLEKIKILIFNA
jgi:mRNA interferase MazF